MIPAIIIVISALILFSGILAVRGICRLYRNNEYKKAIPVTVFFVAIPLLICGSLLLQAHAGKNIWIYLPIVVLVLLWIGGGFLLTFSMRKTLKKRLDGNNENTARPWGILQISACFAGAILIWAFGTFVGFGKLVILEVAALVTMVGSLLATGYGIWRRIR